MHGYSRRRLIADGPVPEPDALKALAVWYRDYAERTDNPAVWHARLVVAELLEQEPLGYRNGSTATDTRYCRIF
jgi:hypothetical protein